MAHPPISACLIVKNEIGQIEACLKSIRPHVDEIVVVDTGSTDGTPDVARQFADKFEVYTDCNDSEGRIESFAMARERSFDLATCPYLFWVDGDDEVVGADKLRFLASQVEERRNGRAAYVMLPYEYSHDAFGNITCLHQRERLITPRKAFQWKSPVHEVLTPQEDSVCVESDFVRIIHRRQTSGKVVEHGRNLRILKKHYEKMGESDIRLLYYLGLEYGNVGDIGNSIRFHKRYIELSGWDDERFLACIKIAEIYQGIGDYAQSIEWATKSLTIREGWSESYFSLAKSYYHLAHQGGPNARRNWERCISFARLGLQIPPTRTVLFTNPMERSYDIHKYLNYALNQYGDVRGALESANAALTVRPDDEGIKMNKGLYEAVVARNNIQSGLDDLVRLGHIQDYARKAVIDIVEGKATLHLTQGPPSPPPILEDSSSGSSAETAQPESIVSLTPTPLNTPLDIIMYIGPGSERWNPDTFARGGLGGSETMAWEMARRLSKLGHKVTFYGDCQDMEGVFDGVQFVNYPAFKDVKCDVFLTSRRPQIVDDSFGISAKVRVCWVHDVHCGAALDHVRSLKIDRFLCLSQWHKDFFLRQYEFLPDTQVVVTRNGIDLSRFSGSETRNPHRIVYSSSPDRGLQTAINAMPRIRESVPDAELHIYYGFKNWEMSTIGDASQQNIIRHLKDLIATHKSHGVVFHDRLSQTQLAREFMKSGVWGYPTWFSETSCITAMEAQAAGLRVVTSPIAALNETVASRGSMIHGDWLAPDYMQSYVSAVVDALRRPGDSDRDELKSYAQTNFGLDSLARDWVDMFRRFIVEMERDVVPPYKAVLL